MSDKQDFDPVKQLGAFESKYSFESDDIYYYNAHRSASLVKRLQNRTEEFDPSIVPTLIDRALGEAVESYDVSKYFGTGHVIVFVKTKSGKNLVLRATHALATPEKYMDMEKEVIERYKKAGIPSTEIVASDTTRKNFPFDYQIMLPLSGKDMASEWTGSKEDYDVMSFDLGRMIAKQYRIPGSGWGRWKRSKSGLIVGAKDSHHDYLTTYIDQDLGVLELFDFTDQEGTEKLRSFFDSNNLKSLFSETNKSYFVHHDIADHNIRYQGQKIVALYDWENAVVYDPISDLGSAPTWKTHYPREQKLIEGYVAELGRKPSNLDEKIAVYFLRTMLWKVQFALKGQRLNARHIDLIQDALRRNGLSIKISTDWVK